MIAFKNDSILDAAFFGLIFSIFASLNSITYQLIGISQIASPLILIFCLVILTKTKLSRSSFNHFGIFLLYGFFLTYHFLGFGIRLYLIEVVYRNLIFNKMMNFVTSMIIIVSVHQYLYKRLVKDNQETIVFNLLYLPILFSCFYALFQSLTGIINVVGDNHGRVMGVFGNPNALGMVANLAIALTIYSSYRHSRFTIIKVSILPLLLYVSFLSLSRASMITSAAVIIFSMFWVGINFFKSKYSIQKKYFFIAGIPIFIIAYIGFNFEAILLEYTTYWEAKKILSMIDLVFQGNFSKENTSGRSEVFKFGYKAIANRPIFGNGLGYFSYFPEELGFEHGAHNTYLLVWGDAGIFSFILFLIYKCFVFLRSFFIENLSGMLAFMCMLIWAMQNIGSHNGLDDKMSNILITFATVLLIFGATKVNFNKYNALEKNS